MSRERPLVSIVTASFRSVEGLRATVYSVSSQLGVTCEHVVIDGGSDDGTIDYLESLCSGVRWVSEPDRGIAHALNKGIAMARGDWVIVLQAGDTFVDAGTLARVAPALKAPHDIVSGTVLFGAAEHRWVSKGASIRSLLHMTAPHQGMFCRRTLFTELGGFDESFRITMDYEWFLRARGAGVRCSEIDIVVARMPDDGISSRRDWTGLKARLDECRRLQMRHASGALGRILYRCYWTAYLPYKRLRAALERTPGK